LNFNDFIKAINSNYIKSVEIFLTNKDSNPAEQNNQAFIDACYDGNFDTVKLLLKDYRINPADDNNIAFIMAGYREHVDIIKLLLNDNRINPTDHNNKTFINACYNENINIIKLFIEYNIYHFDFDFENKDKFYFLKKIYPTLNKDINKYLTSMNKEDLIIELQKHFISDKISMF
jgi:ankyrin repeat protein